MNLDRLKWLLPGLVGALVYANTTGMDFVWDDFYLILEDHTVKSFNYLDVIFTSDFFGHQEWDLAYGYYRPLVSLSYLLDYAVWQRDPFGYHLTNLLWHAVAVLLAGAVLIELRVPKNAAWWTAMIFAVHPMHTENVVWISGRTDVLAFVFAMLAMWAHLRASKSKHGVPFRVAAAVAFFAALLAKEPAVVVIPWLGIAALFVEKQPMRRAFFSLLPYVAVVAAYVVLRFVIADVPGPNQRTDISLLTKLATAPFTVLRYVAWLVLPINQSAYVQNPFIAGNADVRLYVGILGIWALGYAAYRLTQKYAAVGPLIWMFIFAMLPIAGVASASGPKDMGAVMAERFLYFPSFPFIAFLCVAAATQLEAMTDALKVRRGAVVLAGILVVALGAKTVVRNRVWQNNEVFYSKTLESVPSALIAGNLAIHYIHTEQWDKAEQALSDLKETYNPNDYHLLASKALLHVARREFKRAIVYQKKVAEMAKRGRGIAYNNLAFLYRMNGDLDKAEALLEEIIYNNAGYGDVYFNLGEVYRARGKFDEAKKAYQEALRRRPDNLQMAAAYAAMLMDAGDLKAAVSVFETQLEMYPNDPGLRNNLGVVYKRMNRLDKAVDIFAQSVNIDPAYTRARLNLARTLKEMGKQKQAMFHLQYLIENSPQSKEAARARFLLDNIESGQN